MKHSLLWLRRDLRLNDNPALHAVLAEGGTVTPVFILDPEQDSGQRFSPRRAAFLTHCLISLSHSLREAGSFLLVRSGRTDVELARLIRENSAHSLFWNEDVEPEALKLEDKVRALCLEMRVQARSFPEQNIQPPSKILKADGLPYTVFTPYAKAWRLHTAPEPLPAPEKIPSLKNSHPFDTSLSTVFPSATTEIDLPAAGEKAALDCLKRFMDNAVFRYKSQRDYPALNATSCISPHLRFGTLSPRTVLSSARSALRRKPEVSTEIDVFVNELIWRDFYKSILFHFPHAATGCFRREYDALEWENDKALFQAWCRGLTGYPIVDAAMRQLNQTGWMHNRLRMIAASFLTKDLLVSWQWGERYFMEQLLDGDLAANNGGWQWAAGTGTDAQPYFRIFNPSNQTEKFDPGEKFIETYIPEVNSKKYPMPVVSHAERRQAALRMFQKVRHNSG